MNAIFIIDKDKKTELSEDLKVKLYKIFDDKGYKNETVEIGKDEVFPCLGCFQCTTGECVRKDIVYQIRKNVQKYDLTVFLTPILFGHFSSVIKNAIDRGAGSHNWQVIIGYGSDIDDEEKRTFMDLIAKHRGSADIVHPGMDRCVDVFVTRFTEDSTAICEALKKLEIGEG